jgi:hypothetical protein
MPHLQYSPVALFFRIALKPGWIGAVLLGLAGSNAQYCSAGLVPSPFPM